MRYLNLSFYLYLVPTNIPSLVTHSQLCISLCASYSWAFVFRHHNQTSKASCKYAKPRGRKEETGQSETRQLWTILMSWSTQVMNSVRDSLASYLLEQSCHLLSVSWHKISVSLSLRFFSVRLANFVLHLRCCVLRVDMRSEWIKSYAIS